MSIRVRSKMPAETLISLLTAQFNTTLERVEKASTKLSNPSEPASREASRTSDTCAKNGSSSCLPSEVSEMLVPLPRLAQAGSDHLAMWTYHMMLNQVQKMLFDNNPIQMEFDFGASDA